VPEAATMLPLLINVLDVVAVVNAPGAAVLAPIGKLSAYPPDRRVLAELMLVPTKVVIVPPVAVNDVALILSVLNPVVTEMLPAEILLDATRFDTFILLVAVILFAVAL
jgi:hypothetical protein